MTTRATIAVGIEHTDRKVFASALEWPGWSRGARTEANALASLEDHRERYASVLRAAHIRPPGATAPLEVVQRLTGDASTAFGIPAMTFGADRDPVTPAEAERLARIVEAGWAAFRTAARRAPESLRKGPRGGGRDRSAIQDHVAGADHGYARSVGLRGPEPADDAALEELRADMIGVLRHASDGLPEKAKWLPRYAARRIAWHALDHAWEMEDRTER